MLLYGCTSSTRLGATPGVVQWLRNTAPPVRGKLPTLCTSTCTSTGTCTWSRLTHRVHSTLFLSGQSLHPTQQSTRFSDSLYCSHPGRPSRDARVAFRSASCLLERAAPPKQQSTTIFGGLPQGRRGDTKREKFKLHTVTLTLTPILWFARMCADYTWFAHIHSNHSFSPIFVS